MILILILEFFVVKSIIFQIICLALFIGSLVTGIVTYLVCPGITFKEKVEYENNKNLKGFYCQICNFTYPKIRWLTSIVFHVVFASQILIIIVGFLESVLDMGINLLFICFQHFLLLC